MRKPIAFLTATGFLSAAGLLWLRARRAGPDNGYGVLDADEARALYDRLAPAYDLVAGAYALLGARRLHRRAVRALGLRPGDTVVSLGCGTGLNLEALTRAVGPAGRVVGVDLSAGMLDQAQARVRRHGLANVELVQGDVRSFRFPEPLGGVLAVFALEMVPGYDGVIERAVAALRPGGRIAVSGLRRPRRLARVGCPPGRARQPALRGEQDLRGVSAVGGRPPPRPRGALRRGRARCRVPQCRRGPAVGPRECRPHAGMTYLLWIPVLLAAVWAAHWGAEHLAAPLKKLRQKWGISVAAGGALIGLAAASPEVGIATSAAIRDVSDIGLGSSIGSNVIAIPIMVVTAYLATRKRRLGKDQEDDGDNDGGGEGSGGVEHEDHERHVEEHALVVDRQAVTVQALPYLGLIALFATLI